MSDEQEDFNAFNSWDCFGATLMLGITPAILNFVFNDKDILSTVVLAGIGGAVALVVLLLSLITRWRIIGVFVNYAGAVLTALYIAFAVYMWYPSDKEAPADEAEPAPALPAGEE